MKQLLLIFATILVFNSHALAMFDVGQQAETPIATSQMTVLQAQGSYESVEIGYLEKWSQSLSTIFVSADELYKHRYTYRLAVNEVLLNLQVTHIETDGCGSQYIMFELQPGANYGMPESATLTVGLVDHSARRCRDLKPYLWELNMVYEDALTPWTNGTLVLGGHPQAVYTILAQ